MFKNRALQVTMVKDDKKREEAAVQEALLIERVVYVKEATKEIIEKTGKAVIAYVAVDTVRKVLVALASKS